MFRLDKLVNENILLQGFSSGAPHSGPPFLSLPSPSTTPAGRVLRAAPKLPHDSLDRSTVLWWSQATDSLWARWAASWHCFPDSRYLSAGWQGTAQALPFVSKARAGREELALYLCISPSFYSKLWGAWVTWLGNWVSPVVLECVIMDEAGGSEFRSKLGFLVVWPWEPVHVPNLQMRMLGFSHLFAKLLRGLLHVRCQPSCPVRGQHCISVHFSPIFGFAGPAAWVNSHSLPPWPHIREWGRPKGSAYGTSVWWMTSPVPKWVNAAVKRVMLLLAVLHPWLVPSYHLCRHVALGLPGSLWSVATLQRAAGCYYLLLGVAGGFL